MKVSYHISLDSYPLDYTITGIDGDTYLDILTISRGSKDPPNHFSDYLEERSLTQGSEKRTAMQNSYTTVKSNLSIGRNVLIAAQYNSRAIDFIQIDRNENEILLRVVKSIETGHCLNYIALFLDRHFLLSWSLDGIICIWNLEPFENFRKIEAHNRYTYGVKAALCSPSGELVTI